MRGSPSHLKRHDSLLRKAGVRLRHFTARYQPVQAPNSQDAT